MIKAWLRHYAVRHVPMTSPNEKLKICIHRWPIIDRIVEVGVWNAGHPEQYIVVDGKDPEFAAKILMIVKSSNWAEVMAKLDPLPDWKD